jgi:hypothetical protein
MEPSLMVLREICELLLDIPFGNHKNLWFLEIWYQAGIGVVLDWVPSPIFQIAFTWIGNL